LLVLTPDHRDVENAHLVVDRATISYEGLYHLQHTHPDSLVSGVYYSSTPEGSGSIIFDDPRGPRPPFDGRYIHQPDAGLLSICCCCHDCCLGDHG
jgi:hypothetical protein